MVILQSNHEMTARQTNELMVIPTLQKVVYIITPVALVIQS